MAEDNSKSTSDMPEGDSRPMAAKRLPSNRDQSRIEEASEATHNANSGVKQEPSETRKESEQKPDEPSEQKHGEQKPGEQKPGEQKPSEQKPGEQKPGEQKPGEQKPSEQKPSERKDNNKSSSADKPAAESESDRSEAQAKQDKPAADSAKTAGQKRLSADEEAYEKVKKQLRELVKRKTNIDRELEDIEERLYVEEGAYLQDASAGNVAKGFEHYTKGSQNRRKSLLGDQDRVFSQGSTSFDAES